MDWHRLVYLRQPSCSRKHRNQETSQLMCFAIECKAMKVKLLCHSGNFGSLYLTKKIGMLRNSCVRTVEVIYCLISIFINQKENDPIFL